MASHISTADARKQKLSNSDTFRFSHLLYFDDLHRDYGVVHLNTEARKAFADTITLSQRHELVAEHQATTDWLRTGGDSAKVAFAWPNVMQAQAEYLNYENLKIASGFELHLKARLLARNFLVHELDRGNPAYRALANEQRRRPISKSELFSISSYMFDGKHNYLPGLLDLSLKFSTITGVPAYQAALSLPPATLDIINDYRMLRNQIHLPGDLIRARHIDSLREKLPDYLAAFVNSEIVQVTNDLIARNKSFNRRPLESL